MAQEMELDFGAGTHSAIIAPAAIPRDSS